ncbi:tetratricopeptide repeat protein [Lentzea sp. NPDC005914]|uniref:AfsR/SARP family transcriptional regulator n=1 Tax=Lentzea sp. NPDC005914 TaxID=3154572 RepID=UPI0033E2E35F
MAGQRMPDEGIRVLGPFEVESGGRHLDPGGPRLRAMLALLAAYAGTPVSVPMFVAELWGAGAPPDAERTVRTYASRLRRGVGPLAGLIVTRAPGYVLLEPDIVDAVRFQRLVREGHAALADGTVAAARERLTAALELWRGRPFDEFDGVVALESERIRLDGVRLDAVQNRVDADLAAGSGAELVAELADLTAAHPGHERLWGQLMTALYRAGRQSEALEAFQRARRLLVEHAGVEPSPVLADIQEKVLAHDPRLLAPSGPIRVADPRPAQLPPLVPGFTGREAELAALDTAVAAARDTIAVVAVCGTAGVGKTALAVRWAHRVAARFPDGQFYVNLRGFDPGGVLPPEEALHGFLTALGVTADRMPGVLQAQVALYRSMTAGKRVLVVLDNARDAAHVRPLLPAEPGSTVMITSRDDLAGLVDRDGAGRVGLDVLDPGEAVDLLRLLIGDQVATAAELEELAVSCARLPLALRVAAELVARRGRVGLDDLADERHRLDLLEAGADADTAVRAVFSWSERHLPPAANRLFWLLGLHPGRDTDADAVAALAGVDARVARNLLEVLHGAHLVESSGPGRWTMHDLLRAFARERAEDQVSWPDRQDALQSLYEHYLTGALDAMDALYPYTKRWRRGESGQDTPSAMTVSAAKTWLDTERLTLVTITGTAGGDLAGYAVKIARVIDQHLNVGYHNADAFSVHQHALSAAEDLGDAAGRARSLLELGRSHARSGAYSEADEHYRRALGLYRRLGDLAGEARTLHALGNNEGRARRYHDALATYGLALTLSQEAGDRGQEAVELASIGQVQHSLGRHEDAMTCYRRAAAIYAEIGQRVGQGRILNDLGSALQSYGRLEEAHDHHQRALKILHDVGDRAAESIAHTDLGRICSRWGRHAEALEHHRQAITVFREIGDLVGEAEVLINLGIAHESMGRYREAADLHQQAETLAQKLGDRLLECAALNGRGRAAGASGRYAEALACHSEALVQAREMEDREQEARSLDELAAVREQTGEVAEARRLWEAALPIYESLNMPEAAVVRQRLAESPASPSSTLSSAHRNWSVEM